MPEPDLDLLIRAAEGAGDIASRFVGPQAKSWDKPDDAGPVTEADLAVNAYLEDTLRAARPDFGWLSEETEDDTGRLDTEFVFIVDPIDGTRSFIEGSRTWAHSIAIARDGEIVAGVVYLPLRERLYAASLGAGATLNGNELRATDAHDPSQAELLSARPNLQSKFWKKDVPPFGRAYRPSLAYRMVLVGQGRFDGMITFRRTWEWDIAAGALIAEEAGAKVTNRTGSRIRFNNADPRIEGVISAPPKLHDALVEAHDPEATL